MTYPIAECFLSINGEGQRAGELAVFLRFPGCNLACSYCDTAWVNEPDCIAEPMETEEILSFVKRTGAKNVTVTGGEPLLQPGIEALLRVLTEEGFHVEVETNGSVDLAPFQASAPGACFTMDYKLPGSGMEAEMYPPNLALLRQEDTLKLVCGSREDLLRVKALLETGVTGGDARIYISPVFGQLSPEEIVEFMKREKWAGVRLQLQLHKFIWPPEQRGV